MIASQYADLIYWTILLGPFGEFQPAMVRRELVGIAQEWDSLCRQLLLRLMSYG